jgi:putative SOS response-associated peptidase YedK
MCGRYTITRQEGLVEDLEAALGGQLKLDDAVAANQWWKARFNVAPTQDAPVVTLRDGVHTLEMMRWGLVPFWAAKPGAAKPPLMINARIEGIDTKRVFRDALERKRCLVPADGFFEWKREGKGKTAKKTPIWIHPEQHRFFAFAGLWSRAKLPAGELHSFTIITGPPNELVAPIHDRMPVVLAREAWNAWLDPSLSADGAHALLGVPPVDNWRAEPVSSWVNVADHDDPRCVEPAPAEEPAKPAQRSLWD